MDSDIDVLTKKISSLSEEAKKFIEKEDLWDGKFLIILKKDYPYLPLQNSLHEKIKLPEEILQEIVKEMKSDLKFRNFLSVDIQFFLSLFENYSQFKKYFGREAERYGIDENKLKILKNCFEDYDEEHLPIDLKIIHSFGFISYKYSYESELDEPQILFFRLLEVFFYRSLEKFKTDEKQKINFIQDISKPFLKVCRILKIGKALIADMENFIYFGENGIANKNTQDFLCCFQYHLFFEEYVNSLFLEKGKVLSNPLIIFNPSEEENKGKKTLQGYFELDGSLCITKDKKLILIECKNGDCIHPQHLTHFIGKSNLIEKIYGIKIDKFLFSTGRRFALWNNFEDFPSCSDIKIFCRKSFICGFSNINFGK